MAQDPNVIQTCINAFIDYEGQFLEALIEVFPECSELKRANWNLTWRPSMLQNN